MVETVQTDIDTSSEIAIQKWEVKVETSPKIARKEAENKDEATTPNFKKQRSEKFVNLVEIPNAIRLLSIESSSPLTFFQNKRSNSLLVQKKPKKIESPDLIKERLLRVGSWQANKPEAAELIDRVIQSTTAQKNNKLNRIREKLKSSNFLQTNTEDYLST